MAITENFICNLRAEIAAVVGEGVDLTEINNKLAELTTSVNTAQATANTASATATDAKTTAEAAKTTAETAKTTADNMQNSVDQLYTLIGGIQFFNQPGHNMDAPTTSDSNGYSNRLLHLEANTAYTQSTSYEINGSLTYGGFRLPYGAYTVTVRAKVPSLPSSATNAINVKIKYYDSNASSGIVVKTQTLKTSNFSKAATWECLAFGVDLARPSSATGVDWSFGLELEHLSSHSAIDVDYVRIFPAGTALGSIG